MALAGVFIAQAAILFVVNYHNMSIFNYYSSPVPLLFGLTFLLLGGFISWNQWCLWKGWPTIKAMVQKNHAQTVTLLILEGVHKDQMIELVLGENVPGASAYFVRKRILVKLHPKNKQAYLPASGLSFLLTLIAALTPICGFVYSGLVFAKL